MALVPAAAQDVPPEAPEQPEQPQAPERAVDTDEDGYTDDEEIRARSDPTDPASTPIDRDGDGLEDYIEEQGCTSEKKWDSDGDGYSDGHEADAGSDPCSAWCTPDNVDCDGLWDWWERKHFGSIEAQGPYGDPDGDGEINVREQGGGTDPNDADTDDDGLSDFDENRVHRTEPNKWDSDGDGFSDGEEVDAGTDPRNPRCTPIDQDCEGWESGNESEANSDPHDYYCRPTDTDCDGLPFILEQFVDFDSDRRDMCTVPVENWNHYIVQAVRHRTTCAVEQVIYVNNPLSTRGVTVYSPKVDRTDTDDPVGRYHQDDYAVKLTSSGDALVLHINRIRDPLGGGLVTGAIYRDVNQEIRIPVGEDDLPTGSVTLRLPVLDNLVLHRVDHDHDGVQGLWGVYHDYTVNRDGTVVRTQEPRYGQIAGPDIDDEDCNVPYGYDGCS